jgi:hypothetical protein
LIVSDHAKVLESQRIHATAELQSRVRSHVSVLAELIGERNTARPSALEAARDYIRRQVVELGLAVVEQRFPTVGRAGVNLEVTIHGSNPRSPPLVIGAHYDSVRGLPGADDNASAPTAAITALDELDLRRPKRRDRLRFPLNVVWPALRPDVHDQ